MNRNRITEDPQNRVKTEVSCRREVLAAAVADRDVGVESLEQILDHLERK